jgi:putative effector of murein hydrolase LrgA (UPF0299 family)
MLEQIARIMPWLCVGEIAARSGLLPLPAPITGLILLYVELTARGKLPDDLRVLADRLLQFLGMLFVPVGVLKMNAIVPLSGTLESQRDKTVHEKKAGAPGRQPLNTITI